MNLIGEYSTIYRALVIDNKDPERLGRIKVRVPSIHGDVSQVSNEGLPYAMPCFPYGGYDEGSFIVPTIGTVVFVLFENGEKENPVYIGQSISKGYGQPVYYSDYSGNEIIKPAFKNETIQGMYDENDRPTKKIIYKSNKGATIEVEDNNNEEYIAMHDNLGQSFTMYSPMDDDYNLGLSRRRGLFSVLKSKFQYSLKTFSMIILKAINGSKLRFISKNKSSDVDLLCVYEDKTSGVSINIGDRNSVLIFHGDTKFEISNDSISMKANKVSIDCNEFINTYSKVGNIIPTNDFKDSNIENEVKL